jgi:hypothetical protein
MTNQPRSGSPGGGFENVGRKIDETVGKAVPRVEEELKKIIAFLNDEVVPKVREDSSKGLRIAAEQLTKLAEHLDRTSGPRQNPPNPGQSK